MTKHVPVGSEGAGAATSTSTNLYYQQEEQELNCSLKIIAEHHRAKGQAKKHSRGGLRVA
jgi:hypothetical protein